MKHSARIAIVAIGSALYAPVMALATIQIVGGQNLQDLFDWIVGRPCTGDCRPAHFLAVIALTAPLAATLPALIWAGLLWIRRSRRSDVQVAEINDYIGKTRDWTPVATSEIEPDVPRFYRDRQGRLRPLEPPEA